MTSPLKEHAGGNSSGSGGGRGRIGFRQLCVDLVGRLVAEHDREVTFHQKTVKRLMSELKNGDYVDPGCEDEGHYERGFSGAEYESVGGGGSSGGGSMANTRRGSNASVFSTIHPSYNDDYPPLHSASMRASFDAKSALTFRERALERSQQPDRSSAAHVELHPPHVERGGRTLSDRLNREQIREKLQHQQQRDRDRHGGEQQVDSPDARGPSVQDRESNLKLPGGVPQPDEGGTAPSSPGTSSPPRKAPANAGQGDEGASEEEEEDDDINPFIKELFVMRLEFQMSEEKIQQIQQRLVAHSPTMLGDDIQRIRSLTQFLGGTGEEERGSPFAIHPLCKKRLMWDLTAMFLLMFDLAVIPLQAFELPDNAFFSGMDIISLLYWQFDMVASCITGVYIDGRLSMWHRTILKKYACTWLPFDVLVLAPEWVVLCTSDGGGDAMTASSLARGVRVTRFLRMLRFLRLLRLVKLEKVFADLKDRINSNYLLLMVNIVKLLLGIVVMIHILACAWYMLGKQDETGWIYMENIAQHDFADRYIFSFQWSMARLHPSTFGENMSLKTTEERLFAIMVSLVALGGSGAFISSITNMMAKVQAFRQQRTRKLWVIREYVRENNISQILSARVRKYVEKSLDRKLRQQHAEELAQLLPVVLLMDLHYEVWGPPLAVHPLFATLRGKHPRAVWELTRQALVEEAVLAADVLFATGDVCSQALVMLSGTLSYTIGRVGAMGKMVSGDTSDESNNGDSVISVSHRGQMISEASMWTAWVNCGELLATADASMLAILVHSFIHVMREHEPAMIESSRRARQVVYYLNNIMSIGEPISDLLPPHVGSRLSKVGTETTNDKTEHLS
eukprot:TRINITY_DN28856_c0_g1_i1.p1 TRINITY_DN28856_c0_g1~~TRINITY_DN28856_c0_g1_i1.p1  ORF type:complete len:850 (+),score=179.12 TRINITY_DN28856_c0_g1_i1:246-2795(+)